MPRGFGEIADLPRIDDDDRHSRRRTRPREGDLSAPCRLSHHQRDPRFRMRTGPVFASRAHRHIELRLRNIDSHKLPTWRHGASVIGPALPDTGFRRPRRLSGLG